MKEKTVEAYMQLPYTIEIFKDSSPDNPGWAARVVELPGCMTQAETFVELEAMLEDAMRLWISSALEDGQPIPEPREEQNYSGKFIVRIPKWLHRQLAEQSNREDISLNQYVGSLLASAVSQSPASTSPREAENEALRQMIREEVRGALEEAGLINVTPFEPASRVSAATKDIGKIFQAKVVERMDAEYQQYLRTAGPESRSNELNSSTLNRLAGEE